MFLELAGHACCPVNNTLVEKVYWLKEFWSAPKQKRLGGLSYVTDIMRIHMNGDEVNQVMVALKREV